MEELGSECSSRPLLLTVHRLAGVPNTGGSAIVYNLLLYVWTVAGEPHVEESTAPELMEDIGGAVGGEEETVG
eukprot:COSAG01_NODE_57985_length_309_cov_0.333333_1_plen_72_part_10